MGNNDKNSSDIEKEKADTLASSKGTPFHSVMTPKERRRIVKRFVIAFLDGEIEIDFATAQEYAAREPRPSLFGTSNPKAQHFQEEVADKLKFLEQVSIFLNETTSEEEIMQATKTLFEWLISLRIGKRVKGKFMTTPELDGRIDRLERDVYRIEKALEETTILLKGAGILP